MYRYAILRSTTNSIQYIPHLALSTYDIMQGIPYYVWSVGRLFGGRKGSLFERRNRSLLVRGSGIGSLGRGMESMFDHRIGQLLYHSMAMFGQG